MSGLDLVLMRHFIVDQQRSIIILLSTPRLTLPCFTGGVQGGGEGSVWGETRRHWHFRPKYTEAPDHMNLNTIISHLIFNSCLPLIIYLFIMLTWIDIISKLHVITLQINVVISVCFVICYDFLHCRMLASLIKIVKVTLI